MLELLLLLLESKEGPRGSIFCDWQCVAMNSGRRRPPPLSCRSQGGLLPLDAAWSSVLMRAPVEPADKRTSLGFLICLFTSLLSCFTKCSAAHLLMSSGTGSAPSCRSSGLLIGSLPTEGGATGLKALLENVGLAGKRPKCTS